MSDTFTASDGATLVELGRGELRVGQGGKCWAGISKEWVSALREFFQHERDKELGRWRDPERPNIVVYPCEAERVAHVLDEKTAYSQIHAEGQMSEYRGDRADAVRAYFAAHPEPKPWHDAKPGEVWVITTDNVADEVAVQVTYKGTFRYNDGYDWPISELPIVTARRIWPEVTP